MNGTATIAYLLAGVLFIRSLGGLSKQETAQEGNGFGVLGMVLAVGVTTVLWFGPAHAQSDNLGLALLVGALVVATIGTDLAGAVDVIHLNQFAGDMNRGSLRRELARLELSNGGFRIDARGKDQRQNQHDEWQDCEAAD